MKNLFFIIFMTSATALFALSNEPLLDHCDDSIQLLQSDLSKSSPLPSQQLESKMRRHRRHHSSSHKMVDGLAYGSFYRSASSSESISIAPVAVIPLTNTTVGREVFLQNGSVLITQAGDYLVDFGVSLERFTSGRIALALNGVFPQPGSNITISEASAAGLTTATTIVRVETVPAILSLVNNGTDLIVVTTDSSTADVVAFITVEQLSRLPK